MLPARGYATNGPKSKLEPFSFTRRDPGSQMLNFCGEHNTPADVEVVPIQDVEKAYDRTVKGDVRYRFVIDMKTL